jgi:hypothetical protein
MPISITKSVPIITKSLGILTKPLPIITKFLLLFSYSLIIFILHMLYSKLIVFKISNGIYHNKDFFSLTFHFDLFLIDQPSLNV